ncbi:MAG: hypothetical protein M3441_15265, partial [Chloroflexota bacterium]|nr:hypothetical protein [Chloroflexota bacterium]
MRRGRIAGAVALCLFSLALGLGPGLRGTFALLTARTSNPSSVFAATALYAPGSLQASPSGRSAALGWTAGQNGSGYKVLGFGNGTSSTCPASTSASYTAIGTATTLSYTDANRSPAGVPQGTWYCYQVQTTYQSWNSIQNNPVAGAQVGVVATAVQIINLNASRIDTGDQMIFTFNQAITPGSGPVAGNTVCSTSTTIWVGTTATTGGCATTETVNVGRIAGGTMNENARWSATYVWSNSNRTLTVTLGARTAGNKGPTLSVSTWTFTPTTTATKLLSSAGSFHICDSNTGGGNCTPVVTLSTSSTAGAQQSAQQSVAADADNVVATATITATAKASLTSTKTRMATSTPSPTSTRGTASTSTVASSPTAPATPSSTSTSTVTSTATASSSATSTETTAPSATIEATATSLPTETPTQPCAGSPTATPTGIAGTSQATPTAGPCMPTATATVAATQTHTASPTPTHTAQPTQTVPA